MHRSQPFLQSTLCIMIGCRVPTPGSRAIGSVMKDEVTSILRAVEEGDPRAAERLLPLIYDELRALASRKLAHERPGQTLQATALVHEAYIRLVDSEKVQSWDSRGHFFAAAAEAMRRILIEKARQKSSQRRGHGRARSELREDDLVVSPLGDELLDLDEALTKLAAIDAAAAAVAKLRIFAGMAVKEIAEIQRISPRTAERKSAQPRLAGAGGGRIQAVARRLVGVAENLWRLPSPFFALRHRTDADDGQSAAERAGIITGAPISAARVSAATVVGVPPSSGPDRLKPGLQLARVTAAERDRGLNHDVPSRCLMPSHDVSKDA